MLWAYNLIEVVTISVQLISESMPMARGWCCRPIRARSSVSFGADTRMYGDATGIGLILTVSDGRHATTIALLDNYMAGSFVLTADGHGGMVGHGSTATAQAAADAPSV
jgi:hypothetical protein